MFVKLQYLSILEIQRIAVLKIMTRRPIVLAPHDELIKKKNIALNTY